MPNILYDPNRIKPIIELLQKRWEENPQMRLCQLLVNICPYATDPFYIEDIAIKKLLKEYNR